MKMNLSKNYKLGFTLIELLIVVAIIGILASIVLASLNSARVKGGDAAIKSNLVNIRGQAEIIYSGSGCYGDNNPVGETTCAAHPEATACTSPTANSLFANSVVAAQIQGAVNAGGGAGRCSALANGTAWAVSVPLKTVSTNAWCVDSTGASKQVTAGDVGITASAVCN